MAKYFEAVLESKKTQHPEGAKTVTVYVHDKMKKDAELKAVEELKFWDPENFALYKNPKMRELKIDEGAQALIDYKALKEQHGQTTIDDNSPSNNSRVSYLLGDEAADQSRLYYQRIVAKCLSQKDEHAHDYTAEQIEAMADNLDHVLCECAEEFEHFNESVTAGCLPTVGFNMFGASVGDVMMNKKALRDAVDTCVRFDKPNQENEADDKEATIKDVRNAILMHADYVNCSDPWNPSDFIQSAIDNIERAKKENGVDYLFIAGAIERLPDMRGLVSYQYVNENVIAAAAAEKERIDALKNSAIGKVECKEPYVKAGPGAPDYTKKTDKFIEVSKYAFTGDTVVRLGVGFIDGKYLASCEFCIVEKESGATSSTWGSITGFADKVFNQRENAISFAFGMAINRMHDVHESMVKSLMHNDAKAVESHINKLSGSDLVALFEKNKSNTQISLIPEFCKLPADLKTTSNEVEKTEVAETKQFNDECQWQRYANRLLTISKEAATPDEYKVIADNLQAAFAKVDAELMDGEFYSRVASEVMDLSSHSVGELLEDLLDEKESFLLVRDAKDESGKGEKSSAAVTQETNYCKGMLENIQVVKLSVGQGVAFEISLTDHKDNCCVANYAIKKDGVSVSSDRCQMPNAEQAIIFTLNRIKVSLGEFCNWPDHERYFDHAIQDPIAWFELHAKPYFEAEESEIPDAEKQPEWIANHASFPANHFVYSRDYALSESLLDKTDLSTEMKAACRKLVYMLMTDVSIGNTLMPSDITGLFIFACNEIGHDEAANALDFSSIEKSLLKFYKPLLRRYCAGEIKLVDEVETKPVQAPERKPQPQEETKPAQVPETKPFGPAETKGEYELAPADDIFEILGMTPAEEKESVAQPEKTQLEKDIESFNNGLDLNPGETRVFDYVPNLVYHGTTGISSTKLKDACVSLMYYNGVYNTGAIEKSRGTHFDVGNLAHTLILEPENVDIEYKKKPDMPEPTQPQREKYDAWVKDGKPENQSLKPSDKVIAAVEDWIAAGKPENQSLKPSDKTIAAVEAYAADAENNKAPTDKQASDYKAWQDAGCPEPYKGKPTDKQIADYEAWEAAGKPEPYSGKPSDICIERCEFWDAFTAANENIVIVDEENWKVAEDMAAAVMAHEFAGKIIKHPQRQSERSYYKVDENTGLLVKVRPDIEVGKVLGDVKTIQLRGNPDEEWLLAELRREIKRRKYHVSAAMYIDVTGAKQFIWIFVNKEPGYHWVAVVKASKETLSEGYDIYRSKLDSIKHGYETGVWPEPVSIQKVMDPETHKIELPEV